MSAAADGARDTFQARFERRWGHLTRPHVRALAWLLAAPDLLDAAAPAWGGRIASLASLGPESAPGSPALAAWLAALQHDPAPLDAALGARFYSRLGLYAEKLMAFYFAQRGLLEAHGLQVRANRNDTVGEFDFLLRHQGRLLHWEFATKFYLLAEAPDAAGFNGLVGPNLADTLGAKMRKILDQQLALSRHPAAAVLLPQPVDAAQALVKGWLFYPHDSVAAMAGIAPDHNHGYWCPLADVGGLPGAAFVIMPRLLWLAPLKAADLPVLDRAQLHAELTARLAAAAAPVMVAEVAQRDGWAVESRRGFIVPDDWLAQAGARRLAGSLP